MDIQGRTALVTGAGSGIGRSVALRLSAAGARVALMGRRKEFLEETAREVQKRTPGAGVLVIPGDISREPDIQACVSRTRDAMGPVEILVNNAAILKLGSIEKMDLPTFREHMEVNYLGTVAMTKEVLLGMRELGCGHVASRDGRAHRRCASGHIATVASIGAKKSFPDYGAYDAAKFAVAGFVDTLRQELHGSSIGVSIILPGVVDTEMGKPFVEKNSFARRMMVKPDVVAGAVVSAIRYNRTQVYVPRMTRGLALLNEISPRGADLVLRGIAR